MFLRKLDKKLLEKKCNIPLTNGVLHKKENNKVYKIFRECSEGNYVKSQKNSDCYHFS